MFSALFKLDKNYHMIQRRVYTLSDMVSQVGGLFEIVCMLYAFLAGLVLDRLYFLTLFKDVFYVQKDETPSSKMTTSKFFIKYLNNQPTTFM